MKTYTLAIACWISATWLACGQGQISFYTPGTHPTRIGSMDGPLAGSEIVGQLLIGNSPFTLMSVGEPLPHTRGLISDGILTLEGLPCGSNAFAQMAAWNSLLWGSDLGRVPSDQLGWTDVVSVPLLCEPQPIFSPRFTMPAIVPIPEPSVLALGLVAGGVFGLHSCWRPGRRKMSVKK